MLVYIDDTVSPDPTIIRHVHPQQHLAALAELLNGHAANGRLVSLRHGGCGLGLAMSSKFSGALLTLPFVVLIAWSAVRPPADRGASTKGAAPAASTLVGRVRMATFALLVLAALVSVVIQASYFFSDGFGAYWATVANE